MMAGIDVLLLSPTGTGKSLNYMVAIAMKRQDKPNAVSILCLPTNAVAVEKTKTNIQPTAFLTIQGNINVEEEGEEEQNATLSEKLEAVLAGDFPIICCSGEAITSKFGRWLVKELNKRRMLDVVVFDEAHKNLRWKMRPDMLLAPAVLRALCPDAWFLYMTATMTPEDVENAKKKFCMRSNVAIISASPILPNHFFINIQRPSNDSGFEGKTGSNGDQKKGLKHVLDLVLQPWKEDLLSGRKPVLTMLFCKVTKKLEEYSVNFCFRMLMILATSKKNWPTK